jgi:hypothetical protein
MEWECKNPKPKMTAKDKKLCLKPRAMVTGQAMAMR